VSVAAAAAVVRCLEQLRGDYSMDQDSRCRFLFPRHFFLSNLHHLYPDISGAGEKIGRCRLLVGCVEGEIEKDVCCQVG
jgi:hypothetical protein